MKKKYVLYRFTAKIEGRTKEGDFELIQSLEGEGGLRVKSLQDIKKWIDLAKENINSGDKGYVPKK